MILSHRFQAWIESKRRQQACRDLDRMVKATRAKMDANPHRRAALKGHARRREGAGL